MEQQRDMFTNRWHKSKPPAPLEVRVHAMLVQTIERFIDKRRWQYTHLPMGEYRPDETGAKLKRMGTKTGWPDLLFLGADGSYALLELKRQGEGLTGDQPAFHQWMEHNKMRCKVVSNYKDAVETLKQWGILSDRVHVQ